MSWSYLLSIYLFIHSFKCFSAFFATVFFPGWQQSDHGQPGQLGSGPVQNKGGKMYASFEKGVAPDMLTFFSCFQLTPEAEERVKKSREVIDSYIREGKGKEVLFICLLLWIHTHGSQFGCFNCVVFHFSRVWSQHWFWEVCTHAGGKRTTGVSISYINIYMSVGGSRDSVSPIMIYTASDICVCCMKKNFELLP